MGIGISEERRRKIVYYSVRILTTAVLVGMWSYLGIATEHSNWWTVKNVLSWIIGFPLISDFANWVAIRVCRSAGLSLKSRSVQTIRRHIIQSVPVEPLPPDILLSVRTTYMREFLFGATMLFFALSITSASLLRFITGLVALLSGVGLIHFARSKKPFLSVNAREIGAYVPSARWEDVEYCDFVTERDVFGKLVSEDAILRDREGEELLSVTLSEARPFTRAAYRVTRARAADYISIKLTGRPRTPAPRSVTPSTTTE